MKDVGEMSVNEMLEMQKQIQKKLQAEGLKEIKALEEKANDLREQIGLKKRPMIRKERPVK